VAELLVERYAIHYLDRETNSEELLDLPSRLRFVEKLIIL